MERRRGVNLLTQIAIKNAKPGAHGARKFYNDGQGLALAVERAENGAIRKRWILRYYSTEHFRTSRKDGSQIKARREAGLGTPHSISLKAVRELAQHYRDAVKKGKDPLVEKHAGEAENRARFFAERAAQKAQRERERHTLLRVTREYHERMVEPRKSNKDSKAWLAAIETHIPKNILDKPIQDVTARDLLDTLIAKRQEVPETGRRIMQRLSVVFADAKVRGLVPSNVIADIKPSLRQSKREIDKSRRNFAALPYGDVPAFVAAIRAGERPSIAAMALEFAIRTGARTREVTDALWTEFDLNAGVWTVPAGRMKGHEQHVVFLPPRAVEILKETKQLGGAYAFPSPQRTNRALSNMAMATVIRRMNEVHAKPIWVDPKYGSAATVHGFRASFSSWAYEVAQRSRPELAREDVIEACLAHQETNRVKAAYSRARFDDDRRELLGMWSAFIDSKPASLHDIARAKRKRKAA